MKRMAILAVTPEVFCKLLQLPEDVELVRVNLCPDRRGVMELVIEGAGWITPRGASISRTSGEITEGESKSVIDWHLPE